MDVKTNCDRFCKDFISLTVKQQQRLIARVGVKIDARDDDTPRSYGIDALSIVHRTGKFFQLWEVAYTEIRTKVAPPPAAWRTLVDEYVGGWARQPEQLLPDRAFCGTDK